MFSQDTTYIALFIDNKEVCIDESFKIEIITKNSQYPLEIINNEYFITDNIDKEILLTVTYKMFTMSYKNINPWILKNKLCFNIDTNPFENKKKKILFNRENKFLYYISISANLSKTEIEKNIKEGVLHGVLITKTYKGKLSQ